MAYFPLFIDLSDKSCLLVGGGEIALRKLETLLDFEAFVVIVAESVCEKMRLLCREYRNRIELRERSFSPEDCKDMELVIAATDDEKVNSLVSDICRSSRIPVNVVDVKEKCSFIFPSYIKEKNVVAAFSSGGNSPLIAQKLKGEAKHILTPVMGDINELLGSVRPMVQSMVREAAAGERIKNTDLDPFKISADIYKEIYDTCIERGELIPIEQIPGIIEKGIEKAVVEGA